MTGTPDHPAPDRWARPLWTPGGGDAFVHLVVFGADPAELVVDPELHHLDGLPEELELHQLDEDLVAAYLEPPLGDLLAERDVDALDAVATTDTALVVTGTVVDPPDLRYLRAAMGLASACLDAGGVGVLSLQNLTLFDRASWRELLEGDDALDLHLAAVLCSPLDEPPPDEPGATTPEPETGAVWVHTRGMRTFGRPDLSIDAVAPDQVPLAMRLCHALMGQLERGVVIADGSRMDIGGPAGVLTFRRRGHLDDPAFNNVHLEIDWVPGEAE
jgi:hypothetical protein